MDAGYSMIVVWENIRNVQWCVSKSKLTWFSYYSVGYLRASTFIVFHVQFFRCLYVWKWNRIKRDNTIPACPRMFSRNILPLQSNKKVILKVAWKIMYTNITYNSLTYTVTQQALLYLWLNRARTLNNVNDSMSLKVKPKNNHKRDGMRAAHFLRNLAGDWRALSRGR